MLFSSVKGEESPQNDPNWRPSELYFGSYLATDRQKKRELEVAKQLIKGKKYTDGIRLLTRILAAESDSLDPSRKSLKRQAAAILGSLPPAGQRTFATMFENDLERELAIALEQRDQASLAKLAANFPPKVWGNRPPERLEQTDFGQTAWEAWAWSEQERGNDAMASSIRSAIEIALTNSSSTQPDFIEISFDNRLALAKDRASSATASVSLPTQRWMDRNSPLQWLGPGGGVERRFESVGSVPTSWRSWYVVTGTDSEVAALDKLQTKMPEQAATLPTSNAIAVDGVIVIRQGEQLIGIEAVSGKRQWLVDLTDEAFDPMTKLRQNTETDRLPPQLNPLSETAWLDRVHGTLTSDSRSVFVITPSQEFANSTTFEQQEFERGSRGRDNIEPTNALACYDLARQGKLRWRLDGSDPLRETDSPDSDPNKQLKRVRFLGAPTPLDDWLAILAEQQGMIRLLLLESQTGKILWQQPLVSYTGMRQTDALRRIGVSPIWHQGCLYCPTGTGVVLAVDPFQRTINWVAHMPIDKKLISQGNLSSGRTGLRTADSRLRNGNGWRETRLVAKGNAILVATAESNRLTCFDADTGELRWSQPMENGLLLSSTAALQNRVDPEKELDSQVIVIESKSLAAVKLSDGSKLWRIYFSAGERPAGDGVLLGEEYLLPLDSGRLARVSMLADTLQRLSYLQLGLNPLEQRPKPGNLLAHQGALFVRSSLAIERYEQPNTKNEKVVQAESLLTAGESIQAYDAFNQLIGKKPDQLELINRRDASALLGERAEKVTNNLPLSNQLVSEQRIEPLLYRFHSCVRQNNKTEAKSIGADILVRPECKTHYVALSNTCEVLVERWIQSELANLEQMPRAIDLSENKRFTESVDNNKQINRSDWATNQVSTSVTISKSENKQKQRTNFSRRNIRNVNSIPQRLGVRGVGSEISRWEVYNNGGESPELVGRNNFGEIAFATQLPSAVEGPLLASVVGESASCCWGNQVLIQLSDSIVAFDLSNHQESDRVLWNSLTLEEESLEALPLYEVVPNSVKLANRGLLNHSDQGDKLYHTDAWGAVVRRQGKIATVDPKTGKIIWSVNDWHSYDRVFSLEDRIYFGRTSSREGIILSKEDGSTLGNWHVPNGDWRNYCSGRLFLTTRGEAQLYDITQESETPIWQSSLKEKQYVIVDEAILLIDRVGHLVCVDMITGKIRFETNLKLPNSRLPFLQAKLVGKNLIVGLSEQSTSGHRQLGFTPVGERPLITGLLYNLDLMTGNLNWPHAIEIEGVGLLDDDSVDSQLLFFSGREQNMQSNSGISWNRLLVVDLLSGRSLYRNDRLPAARQGHIDFQVLKEYATKERSKASPADQTDADTQPEQVLVQLGTAQVRLELTSEPSPPSPPALAYIERPRKKGVNFNEVGQGLSRLFEEITQPIENPDK